MAPDPARAEIVVDTAAIRANVRRLQEVVGDAAVMVVVKADGYGHGMTEAARAARQTGTEWLGVATLDEAVALREAGDTGRILCWLGVPGEHYANAVELDVDVTAYSLAELAEIETAARQAGGTARVQLKVDTGLSRGGCALVDWPALAGAAARAEQAGSVRITGIWSHFACADEPDHPANDRQEDAFRDALAVADEAGLAPEVRHLANSAAAILRPSARFDLVRCGIACYGLDPAPGQPATAAVGLVPAMTARARLAMVKHLATGDAVSYGHTWTAEQPTTVGLVPVGYGDGVPRAAGNRAEASVGGKRRPIRGVVCMDQFVVDLTGDSAEAGDEVVLFGTGSDGGPTATDWAQALGTINYEIVTRIGGRFARRHVDSDSTEGEITA